MDVRRTGWGTSFRSSVIPQTLDNGPKVLMAFGVTITGTWGLAIMTQSTNGRLSFHSWVFYSGVGLIVGGFLLWVVRTVSNDRNPNKNMTALTTDEITGVRRLLETTGNAPPKELASMNVKSPENVQGTVTIAPGGLIVSAIGVGPLTVAVPSGKPYGADPDKPFEFTTNADPQRIALAEGGTVTAYLSATVNIVSTVKGELSVGTKDEEGE